jgi:hypothetical protein
MFTTTKNKTRERRERKSKGHTRSNAEVFTCCAIQRQPSARAPPTEEQVDVRGITRGQMGWRQKELQRAENRMRRMQ